MSVTHLYKPLCFFVRSDGILKSTKCVGSKVLIVDSKVWLNVYADCADHIQCILMAEREEKLC